MSLTLSDIRGIGRLSADVTAGVTGIVEAMHANIARTAGGYLPQSPLGGVGISATIYRSIRGAARLTGIGLDALLAPLTPASTQSSPSRDNLIAALNGVVGDHLAETGNPLATVMRLRHADAALDRRSLAAIPNATGRLAVLVHGLCLSHHSWQRKEQTHAATMLRGLGYTEVHLHYNTGLHISTNGQTFAALLDQLVADWPVPIEDLVIIGHSMGGLVSRSACHYAARAGHRWPHHLTQMFFVGTPHQGAPLERGGHQLDLLLGKTPYTSALTQLGRIRSAGITDLRYGNLIDEDHAHDRFAPTGDRRRDVALPEGVVCYALAAMLGFGVADDLVGDGLVPLASALGYHDDPALALGLPEERHWVGYGMGHLDLLNRKEVYDQIGRWIAER